MHDKQRLHERAKYVKGGAWGRMYHSIARAGSRPLPEPGNLRFAEQSHSPVLRVSG
jgi:hypothetical protein